MTQRIADQIATTYHPDEIETGTYAVWESQGYFKPSYAAKESFSIVLPPPNVTGSLHMGHGFNNTIMDALTRYHRMQGCNTLWQPGTDHAGIATQTVVERQLGLEGLTRHDLGRDAFLEKVWAWKKHSGGTITGQIRRLGSSVDWSKDRFTLDDGLSNAVIEVFVRLYDDGLIYRGKRLVNWDPKLHTALSDLEVENHDEQGSLWHFKYQFADASITTHDGKDYLVVATTRPETLLGDTAVAVNPDDERFSHLIGKTLKLPITNRIIPIVADNYVEQDFGSGCVKITPAHDFNDYELGKRHDLPLINIFDQTAAVRDQFEVFQNHQTKQASHQKAPNGYAGLDRFDARKKLLRQAKEEGWLYDTENYALKAPRSERSREIVEPMLTDQWYVAVKSLAEPAIKAVEDDQITFVPSQYKNMYMSWMREIQDWCISRQLWWGHRIPAWYDDDGNHYVGRNEAEVRKKYQLGDINLTQDDDVLDTWFSSALWTFSTLGWPEKTDALTAFHPTSVLVTGFDIIFFWVARMIMMTLHFVKDDQGQSQVPFKTVYVHGLVRDSSGQKMSKSKGNVLDPIDIIDGIDLEELVKKRTTGLMNPNDAPKIEKATRKDFPDGIAAYGTDALRFTFCSLASTGRDINFSMKRVEGYRNFCNKIWNASRFVLMNLEGASYDTHENQTLWELPENWIMSRLHTTIKQIHNNFANYRLDLAASALYDLIWNQYCDWYLELAKASLNDDAVSVERKAQIRYVLLTILESMLRLSHPIMPFITENLWQTIAPLINAKQKPSIMLATYPQTDNHLISTQTESDMQWLQSLITSVRNIRGEMKLGNAIKLPLLLAHLNGNERASLARIEEQFKALAKVEHITIIDDGDDVPPCASSMVGNVSVLVPMKGLIDPSAERERLGKISAKLIKQHSALKSKLDNQGFISKAPAEVVQAEREKLTKIDAQLAEIDKQMATLDNL